nr:HAMP domain-containing sensor histidine kinase [Elusimicrobiota bacterium]
ERRTAALRSAMMHTVSHEFNNAITVLDASLFLLKESEPPGPPENRRQLYDTLQFELRSLSRYVKNILNEARMESGRLKLQMRRLVLRDLIYKLASSMKPLIAQKSLTLYMDFPEEPVEVSADMEAISLVISNLIGNAVKYTPERGSISVRLAGDGQGRLNFLIENSGAGIQPEEIGKLKRGFYRTQDAKAAASGFGLGLRISNELLQLHGSELGIKSEPGRSSTFYFSLPVTGGQGESSGHGTGRD